MTPAGKAMTGVIGLSSLGTVSVDAPVYLVCCVLVGLLLSAEICGLLFKPSLEAAAEWPATLTVGEAAGVNVRITNRSSWRSAYDLMLLIPSRPPELRHINANAFIPKLAPGGTCELTADIICDRRGRLTLEGLDIHSTFPFNLLRSPGARTRMVRLKVLPKYTPLSRIDLPVNDGSTSGQFVLSGSAGESTEYLGNRDYSPGEPVRRLDFRAWARLGKPVVKEYQDEHASRVGLLVDTLRPSSGGHRTERFEAGVSVAAAVVDAVLTEDFGIGVFATGTDLWTLPTTYRSDAVERFLERLATVVPTSQAVYDEMLPALLDALENSATLTVVLCDWDTARESLIRQLAVAGPPLKVVLIESPRTPPADAIPGEQVTVVRAADVRSGELANL